MRDFRNGITETPAQLARSLKVSGGERRGRDGRYVITGRDGGGRVYRCMLADGQRAMSTRVPWSAANWLIYGETP